MTIKRYDPYIEYTKEQDGGCRYPYASMEECSDGGYVLHKDHIAKVSTLEKNLPLFAPESVTLEQAEAFFTDGMKEILKARDERIAELEAEIVRLNELCTLNKKKEFV